MSESESNFGQAKQTQLPGSVQRPMQPLPSVCAFSPELRPLHGAAALNELFRLQYEQFVRFCRARIGNHCDAEDLVQDAFLSVRRSYPDKPVDELRALLFTTLRNLTLNHMKSGRIRQQKRSEEIGEMADALACQRTSTPEQKVMDAQLLIIAERTIEGLKPRKRAALRLHRYEGLTYDEIARRLSVSPTTVKTDIAEAIAKIAETLSDAARRGPGEDR